MHNLFYSYRVIIVRKCKFSANFSFFKYTEYLNCCKILFVKQTIYIMTFYRTMLIFSYSLSFCTFLWHNEFSPWIFVRHKSFVVSYLAGSLPLDVHALRCIPLDVWVTWKAFEAISLSEKLIILIEVHLWHNAIENATRWHYIENVHVLRS